MNFIVGLIVLGLLIMIALAFAQIAITLAVYIVMAPIAGLQILWHKLKK